MAVLFYILGWLSILGGLGWAGYNVYSNMTAAGISMTQVDVMIGYFNTLGLAIAAPGLSLMFTGLILLAVGGVLSRLDEIAYNTRTN